MKLTENGVSTTKEKGQFAYVKYGPIDNRKIKWDYRDTKGKLYSGVTIILSTAIALAELRSGEEINPDKIRKCE